MPIKDRRSIAMQTLERPIPQQTVSVKKRKKSHKILKGIGFTLLFIVVAIGTTVGYLYTTSLWPATINMSSTCGNMAAMHTMNMDGMQMSGSDGMCTGPLPHSGGTPISALQAPQTAAHVDTFTLTAQPLRITLEPGSTVDALSYNGVIPGPTLHVRQGDLVVVHLVNHMTVPVTIHWHGVRVPNSSDGVAGITQDAVKPGQSYIYRFIAKDAGTYWYHSHEFSYDQTSRGLYGALIVDPAQPTTHDDVDATLQLHDWILGGFPSFHVAEQINGSTQPLYIPAKPGQWVRLRIINTGPGSPHVLTLLGAPFTVAAMDGHDINGPTPLVAKPIIIGSAQRYDLRFQMPANGAVTMFRAADGPYEKTPVAVIGQGPQQTTPPAMSKWFDFSNYGKPSPTAISMQSHFDATYTVKLNNHIGFINGHFGPLYTINGQTFPNTPTIVVQPGQLVRLHLVNESKEIHPIHLHGHTFAVLTRNGHALTGSPVLLDTINILPHETYDIAFLADNPGIWMLHCHNLFHTSMGMDMMIVYPNISTPYSVGSASGNFPD